MEGDTALMESPPFPRWELEQEGGGGKRGGVREGEGGVREGEGGGGKRGGVREGEGRRDRGVQG